MDAERWERARAICRSALTLDPETRSDYLTRECEGDGEMRAGNRVPDEHRDRGNGLHGGRGRRPALLRPTSRTSRVMSGFWYNAGSEAAASGWFTRFTTATARLSWR